jgi:hypothetical protein
VAGKGHVLDPQTCKGKLEEQRVQKMWTTAIEAFIILKYNRLREIYDIGRNKAMLEIAKRRVGPRQVRSDPFPGPASTSNLQNAPGNHMMVTPTGPRIPTAVGGLTKNNFEAQRIHIQREYQRLEAARINFENMSGQKLPPVAPHLMIVSSTPTVNRQPLALVPTKSFSVRSGIALGPPPGTTASIEAESLAQPRNESRGKDEEKQVSGKGKGKEKEKEKKDRDKEESRRSRKRRRAMEREREEDGEVKESRRKRRMYRRRRSSSSEWRDEGRYEGRRERRHERGHERGHERRRKDGDRLSPVEQALDF